MNLGKHSINRPVATTMLMLVVALLGAISFSRLDVDLLPKINPPVLAIMTTLPEASAQEVQDLVTIPVEAVASTTPGIKEISSISEEETSLVILMFDWGKDLSEAKADLSQRLELITLPEDASRPLTLEFDPNSVPIMQVALSDSKDMTMGELTDLAENKVKPRLEAIDGVGSVDIVGGLAERVNVTLDPAKLAEKGLTQDSVAAVISASNLNYPLGVVRQDDLDLQLRLQGRVTDLDELRDLVVGYTAELRGGQPVPVPVKLSEVATVERGYPPATSLTRVNGKPGVALAIRREGSANTVTVARAVREEIEDLSSELRDLDTVITMDQARFIEFTIEAVQENLLMGAGLAVLVLLAFLRDLRTTLVISVSIPFSVIATFALMYFGKLTLNVMTLGGLALGVGMLVDNSIVVIENIYRHTLEGKDPRVAAEVGSREVAMAITASTLTTVVVFLPVVYVGGVTGIIFKELALTVTFSLLASLVVALTVVPLLASRWFARKRAKHAAVGPDGSRAGAYPNLLRWGLDNKAVVFIILAALIGASVYAAPRIPTEFLPSADEGNFSINISVPEGTPLEDIDALVARIEEIVESEKSVDKYSVSIGSESAGALSSAVTGGADAQILVQLDESAREKKETQAVINSVKKQVQRLQGDFTATFNMTSSLMAVAGGMPSQAQVTVTGPDIAEVRSLSDELVERMKDVEGLEDIQSSLTEEKPEVHLVVDRAKALSYGLTPAQIAMSVSRAVKGQTVSRYEADGTVIDVVVRLDPESVKDAEGVGEIVLQGQTGRVKLKDIATVSQGEGPVAISRHEKRLSARITASINERTLGEVAEDIEDIISDMDVPDGYSITQTGMTEIMNEGFSSLTTAFILAAVLVYMVMAASFESITQPLLIMLTVPLAAIGSVLAMYATGYAFGITAFIGAIILVGVVVNNGIVMVDFINQARASGMRVREAVIEGSSKRVRPVLMTSLTTIIGLVPMALGLGEGGELTAPLAVTIMGGLTSATFLTLVVIPVAYALFARDSRPARVPETARVGTAEAGADAPEPATTVLAAQETGLAAKEESSELVLSPGFDSNDMAQLIELLGKLFSSITRK